jgi:transposase
MAVNARKSFNPELRLKAGKLVVEQNHSIHGAAQTMIVGKSTMDKCVGIFPEIHEHGLYVTCFL